jgi:hypothetical protein
VVGNHSYGSCSMAAPHTLLLLLLAHLRCCSWRCQPPCLSCPGHCTGTQAQGPCGDSSYVHARGLAYKNTARHSTADGYVALKHSHRFAEAREGSPLFHGVYGDLDECNDILAAEHQAAQLPLLLDSCSNGSCRCCCCCSCSGLNHVTVTVCSCCRATAGGTTWLSCRCTHHLEALPCCR